VENNKLWDFIHTRLYLLLTDILCFRLFVSCILYTRLPGFFRIFTTYTRRT